MAKKNKKINNLGIRAAELISGSVGSWMFVSIYTISMILWIIFHEIGLLHIDTEDFMKWNLFLSYFAGIQASILLMAAERQAQRDRKRDDDIHKNTKTAVKQIDEMRDQIDTMENIMDSILTEKFGKIDDVDQEAKHD